MEVLFSIVWILSLTVAILFRNKELVIEHDEKIRIYIIDKEVHQDEEWQEIKKKAQDIS